jgi:hypothetical protein
LSLRQITTSLYGKKSTETPQGLKTWQSATPLNSATDISSLMPLFGRMPKAGFNSVAMVEFNGSHAERILQEFFFQCIFDHLSYLRRTVKKVRNRRKETAAHLEMHQLLESKSEQFTLSKSAIWKEMLKRHPLFKIAEVSPSPPGFPTPSHPGGLSNQPQSSTVSNRTTLDPSGRRAAPPA